MFTFIPKTVNRNDQIHFVIGFTLIELLAVIAIIGVLAALLIPVTQKIRMKALESQALSNIRQIGTGYLMVAQEDNGVLPGWVNNRKSNEQEHWSWRVNNFLSQAASSSGTLLPIFKDPAAIARKQTSDAYGLQFAPLAAITKWRIAESSGGERTLEAAGPANLRAYRRLIVFNHRARQILLADSGTDKFGMGYGDLGAVDGGQFNWEASVAGTPATDGNTPIAPGDSEADNIRWAADGTAKFFFLDGHVERRHQNEVMRNNVNPLYP